MSRRSQCLGDHNWQPAPRTPGRQVCTKCPATFPCIEPCAHGDCEEATGKTAICPVCDEPVAYLDGFHFTSRTKTIRVHAGLCQSAYKIDPEEPEADTEPEPHEEKAA